MKAEHQTVSLQQQLNTANQVAGIAMQTSSDLGVAIQFIKDSFLVNCFDELALHLIKILQPLCLESGVSLETTAGRTFHCVFEDSEKIKHTEATIKHHALDGRIVEFEDAIQINFENSSLLSYYSDISESRVGELRDVLALLMEGVESRVKSLILAEKAEEARKSKDQFFALMSHELRTPLNPIIGYATRLEKQVGKNIDERFGSPITSIKNSGESLLRLINNIIDRASGESGAITLTKQKFDIKEAVDRAFFKLDTVAKSHQTELIKHVENELMFFGDIARFIDIVISVMTYSIKSSTNHSVTLEAKRVKDDVGEILLIQIIDDGNTLCESYRTKIFSDYSDRQLDDIYESNDLGIGLFLTKKLIELHNGSINLHPIEEGGNQFDIRFIEHINSD